MFERRHENLAPPAVFARRMAVSVVLAGTLAGTVLLLGILGYHFIAGFGWVDSLLEASMILGGMGPVSRLPNQAAKVFASFYALFSGLVFIALMGIILAPVAHRMLHKFHLEGKD